ncbi:NAD(P)H-quinone oxidoreductase [Aeromicrobium alkaliterrae]|uniref:NAD(P)H-quinone oxidoreductase n=1 Tax=Aeromicrobium alkaliterrae TaxID=302168 RepID=A0ABN2JE26_9ACTN
MTTPDPGGPEALITGDHPVPQPAAGEVLVRVVAAGVNRADVLQRQGFYNPPPGSTDVLGLEAAGTIVAVGEGVDASRVGEEVVALLAGGGYAEHVAAPAGQVVRRPAGLEDAAAGGLVETAATVWSNVFMHAGLREGETLLVHGGSSGIGTTAIQMAVAAGARVAVTVGSEAKAEFCRELGAEITINYREQEFVDVLKDAGVSPDVILDNMGAKYLDANVRALATGGRLVVIGMQGGVKGELDLGRLLTKRASVAATSLRARPSEEKAAIMAEVVEHVWPWVESGQLRPIVHETFALDQVGDAHRTMEASTHIGKLVLLP